VKFGSGSPAKSPKGFQAGFVFWSPFFCLFPPPSFFCAWALIIGGHPGVLKVYFHPLDRSFLEFFSCCPVQFPPSSLKDYPCKFPSLPLFPFISKGLVVVFFGRHGLFYRVFAGDMRSFNGPIDFVPPSPSQPDFRSAFPPFFSNWKHLNNGLGVATPELGPFPCKLVWTFGGRLLVHFW